MAAEEGEGSWDQTVEEWMISEGYCCAAALANTEDCLMFAAAPQADEAGWGHVFAEPHEEQVDLQGDGNTKKITIDETAQLKMALDTKKTPPGGIWLGGNKFVLSQYQDYESGDKVFKLIFCNRPKKGAHICATESYVIVGMYDEEQGHTSGNCKKAVLAFAEYLATEC